MIQVAANGADIRMKDYRLYFLDRFSGHIDEVREFDAADDEEAVSLAAQCADDRAMELWHRHHKLRHWDESVPSVANVSNTTA